VLPSLLPSLLPLHNPLPLRSVFGAKWSPATNLALTLTTQSDVIMDGAEVHPDQVCLLFLFSSTLDCTSLGAPSSPHENRKAFSCVHDASLSISKPSLDLQLKSLPDARSQTLDIARPGAVIHVPHGNKFVPSRITISFRLSLDSPDFEYRGSCPVYFGSTAHIVFKIRLGL